MTNGPIHRIEVIAGNQQSIKNFFTQVFGATFAAGGGGYEVMSIGTNEVGGLSLAEERPSQCIPFIKVSNLADVKTLALNNGAWEMSATHAHPTGYDYATFRIPEGALIGIYASSSG
jgi:predicted enzyme related to lactoylglutathione lyase